MTSTRVWSCPSAGRDNYPDAWSSPTITRVWGHPNPPTSDPEGIYERGSGWGTTEIPSRYAVVKLEVSGFNKDKPPVLVVRDESASGAPIVEKIWWGGLATETGNPTDGYIVEAPVVLAGDPDPWDDPAKGGDPAERVSRIELLHCGQVVDSVTIRLIKSTRWPGFPAIGVHVVPAVWHDMRADQAEQDIAAIRPQIISRVYNAFFTAPKQNAEVALGGTGYSVQKRIGQARVQVRLLRLRLHSIGVSAEACCNTFNCSVGSHFASWTNLGDADGIDMYDLDDAKGDEGSGCGSVSGVTNKAEGLILFDRFANRQKQPVERAPFISSARESTVVAHELGHLILLLGHATQDLTHMMYPDPGSILPQSPQGVETGRQRLHDAVASPSTADPLRATPDNRYLQRSIAP